MKVDAGQVKQVFLKWTETSGGLWEWWHHPGVPLPFLSRAPPLEMRRKRREFFPEHAGKGSLRRARRRKRGSSGCGRDSPASSLLETSMSGNFLSCKNGVKDPLEVPEVRCEYPRNASAEMVLVSPGGENLLDFLELRQVLSTYDGDPRDPLWWPQERPVPMRLARGPLGIPLPSKSGPKTLCGVGAGT